MKISLEETLECVCLRCSTYDEVDHSLTQSTAAMDMEVYTEIMVWDGAFANFEKL